jgi:hypothetical protein
LQLIDSEKESGDEIALVFACLSASWNALFNLYELETRAFSAVAKLLSSNNQMNYILCGHVMQFK